MSYIKQSAIVLRKKTLRRGNRWYTLLCKDIGKIDILARSAASSASKMAGHLEPGMRSEVMLAPGKEIVHLAGAKTVQSYKFINLDLETALLKISILSAVNYITVVNEEAVDSFELLDNILLDLNNRKLQIWQKKRLVDMFIINLLAIAGFEPNLSMKENADYFSFHNASLVSKDLVDEWVMKVDGKMIKLLEFMLNTGVSWQEKRDWLVKIKSSETAFIGLHSLINKYYHYQVNQELIDVAKVIKF
jgi:DNA repair protein RecO